MFPFSLSRLPFVVVVLLLLLLVLGLACISPSRAFAPGEMVPTQHRTQHKGKRTAWSDAPSSCRPIFGADSTTAEYAVRFGDEELHTDRPLQVEFSFGDGHAKLDDPDAHTVWHGAAAAAATAATAAAGREQLASKGAGEGEAARGGVAGRRQQRVGPPAAAGASDTGAKGNVGHHTGGARQHSTGWIIAWDGTGRYLTSVEVTLWTHSNRIEKITSKTTYSGTANAAASDRPQHIALSYSTVALRDADPDSAAATAPWVATIAAIAVLAAILWEECASSMVNPRRGRRARDKRRSKKGHVPQPRFDLDLSRALGRR